MVNKSELAKARHVHRQLPEVSHLRFMLFFCLILQTILCISALAQEKTAEDWFNKGQELFMNGSMEEAIEAYDKAIELTPQYGMAWGGKATMLSILGRYDESLDAYDKAIETWPANDTERISELWVFKGNTFQLTGRPKEAFEAFDEAIRIYPQNFDAWMWMGESLKNLGQYNESLNAYSVAVEAAPSEIPAAGASAKVAKADVLLKMGRYEEAYNIYSGTSEQNSTADIDRFYSAWSWRGMGSALAGLGRYNESLQAFNKSREVYPKGAFQAWGDEGDAFRDLGRYEQAIAAYNKSIEMAPSEFVSAKAKIGKGQALDKMGKHDEAIKAYEDAVDDLDKTLQQSAFDAQSWYLKGTALKAWGRQAEAEEAYARAEELGYNVQNKNGAEKSSNPKMLAITSIKATGEDEFVVISNSRSVVQNIEGWTLDISDGRNQSIPLPDFALGPGEKINIHLGKGESGKADIFLNSTITLNNTAGHVTLKDETGMGVASFGYRVEPDGSLTGIMTAESEFSYPPSGPSEVNMVVKEAGSGPYVVERTEYGPETAYSWIDKGNALVEQGNYEEAVKALDNATKLSPQDKHIWMSKGLILSAHLSRYNESIEAYERAIHIDPGEADAWFGKGAALNKTGRYEEAITSLDRAIELDPKSVAAWKVKGDALKALGHDTEADDAYAKARELGYQG